MCSWPLGNSDRAFGEVKRVWELNEVKQPMEGEMRTSKLLILGMAAALDSIGNASAADLRGLPHTTPILPKTMSSAVTAMLHGEADSGDHRP
jgi:hypothetical protein